MDKHMAKNRQSGFTLVELVITVAIAIVLLGVGIPRFMSMVNINRVSSNTNDFVQALHLARSEASRSGAATVCTSNDQKTCTGSTWNDGWIVLDSQNAVIRVYDGIDSSMVVKGNTNITYGNNGFLNPVGTQTFFLCQKSGVGREVTITTSGRPSTQTLKC